MKHLIITIFSLFAINALGQIEKIEPIEFGAIQPPKKLTYDFIPRVIYVADQHKSQDMALFINDKFSGNIESTIFDQSRIIDFQVLKKGIQVESKYYKSQARVITKDYYFPKFISLNALKDKYTNLGKQNVIFSIDDKIVNADYDKFLIEESYVFGIFIQKTDRVAGSEDLNLVKVLTRSPDNLKKLREIRIRGAR